MTILRHEEWRKTILADCLKRGDCRPINMQEAYCRYGGATSRVCDYHTCPRRRYYKTDGGCTVTQTDGDTTVILWDDALRVSLTPDRVRFLARALSEIVDAEKEVVA